jgi:hypothetical protein
MGEYRDALQGSSALAAVRPPEVDPALFAAPFLAVVSTASRRHCADCGRALDAAHLWAGGCTAPHRMLSSRSA